MSQNIHAQQAVGLINSERTSGGTFLDPNTQGMMLAQTEAALALAYEQRTANLIAYVKLMEGCNPAEVPTEDVRMVLNSITRDIETRLGLT